MTLTINIDDKKVKDLREKAESQGSSLEVLVETLLDSFLEEENPPVLNDQPQVYQKSVKLDKSPKPSFLGNRPEFIGKSPMEIISELQKEAGIVLTEDFDEKQDYREHILRKHA